MKLVMSIFSSILCLILGLIPEITMLLVYDSINPDTVLLKILLVGIFMCTGLGLCVLFAVGAFVLWATIIEAINE